jgi:hypothetical protein
MTANSYNSIVNTLSGALTGNNTDIQMNMQNVGVLGLRQMANFGITREFKDSDGKLWKLVKSANDASVEVPDPAFVQITDYWNHDFPNSNGKVFIYVVEGIKRPRVDTERPVRVLYQWFSTKNNPQFTPQMISGNEWRRANVYTAQIQDSRVSKLSALCGVEMVGGLDGPQNAAGTSEPDIDMAAVGLG